MVERVKAVVSRMRDRFEEQLPGGRAQQDVDAFTTGSISLREAYRRVSIREEHFRMEPGSLKDRFDRAVARVAEDVRPMR